MLVFCESDDAVADVAGRKNAEFLSKRAGASPFVGDGHDCAEACDRPRTVGVDVAFEAAQQRGEAGTASDCDDVESLMAHGVVTRSRGCGVSRSCKIGRASCRERA